MLQNYLKESTEIKIEKINASIDNNTINKGESKKIQVEILPKEAKDHEIVYTSSNNNIATVDSKGNILGIKPGTCTITIKAKENNVSTSLNITIYSQVTDMELETDKITIQTGEKFQINPVIYPEDANNKKVIYKSEK